MVFNTYFITDYFLAGVKFHPCFVYSHAKIIDIHIDKHLALAVCSGYLLKKVPNRNIIPPGWLKTVFWVKLYNWTTSLLMRLSTGLILFIFLYTSCTLFGRLGECNNMTRHCSTLTVQPLKIISFHWLNSFTCHFVTNHWKPCPYFHENRINQLREK